MALEKTNSQLQQTIIWMNQFNRSLFDQGESNKSLSAVHQRKVNGYLPSSTFLRSRT